MVILVPALTSSLVFITALYVKGKKIRNESAMMGIPKNHMSDHDWKALKRFLIFTITIAVPQLGVAVTVDSGWIGMPDRHGNNYRNLLKCVY